MNIDSDHSVAVEDAEDTQAHSDRPLYVDRRLRPWPQRGSGAEPALSEPAGRSADHHPVRAAGRLYAGRPRRHRLRPAARPAGAGQAAGPGRGIQGAQLRHGAGPAADLEVGDCAGARRDSGTNRLCRRGQIRPHQSMALGRKAPAPLSRQERRACVARRRRFAAGMAGSAIAGAARGSDALSAGKRTRPRRRRSRWRRARSARPSAGLITPKPRGYLAERGLDVWVIGGPGEKADRNRDRRSRRTARARPHRHGPAQRHPGDGRRTTSRSATIPA